MKNKILVVLFMVATGFLLLNSCKKDLPNKPYVTPELTLIKQYVEGVDSLSILTQLIKMTGRESILNAYGNYTLFAPSDRAFKAYFATLGINGVSDLKPSQASYLMNYHILFSNVNIIAQNIGILPYADSTVNGLNLLYLLNGTNIIINKVSKVESTINVANGYVYTMSAVLDPPAANMYDYLVQTGKFTIMQQVLDATNLKDTLQAIQITNPYDSVLNLPTNISLTLFVESDSVLKSKGITSFSQLKDSVANRSKSFTSDADKALLAFARYHLSPARTFLYQLFPNDGLNVTNIFTLALNGSKIIHAKGFLNKLPILNADTGSISGISFIDALSDKIVKNGVIQQLDGILYVPTAIPGATSFVRECEHGFREYYTNSGIKYVFLHGETRWSGFVDYTLSPYFTTDEFDYFHNGAALKFAPLNRGDFVEFDIKDLAPGKYQIMLNYFRDITFNSRNVIVYLYKTSDGFDVNSTPIKASLDLANINSTPPVDALFNQRKSLLEANVPYKTITEYGDYTLRFVHTDLYYANYDAIIFQVVK